VITIAVPCTQTPWAQISPLVQALPSSHGLVLLLWKQPEAGLQPSSVHTLPSLQLGGVPPTQDPPLHLSPVVQALASSHGLVLLSWKQPEAGLQPSSVHTLLSLQLGGGPPTQDPPLQLSPVVQALPSSHEFVLLV
jgi:hypothetical protein